VIQRRPSSAIVTEIPKAYPPRWAQTATSLRGRNRSHEIAIRMNHSAGIWNTPMRNSSESTLIVTRGNIVMNAPVTQAIEPLAPITGFGSTSVCTSPANAPPTR
jgi:hypothetical protein